MAYRSSINITGIRKSLSGLNKSLQKAKESAGSISSTILQSNREKRKYISANASAFRKRREAVRRREREDLVEASTITGAIKRSRTAVVNSTRGFLGRILDFLGVLLVGWALTTLPGIIKAAQNLMKRMQKYFALLNQFKEGLQNFFIGFGDMVGEIYTGLNKFDFLAIKRAVDRGMGRMKDAFVQMNNSIDSVVTMLKQDINKLLGIDILKQPEDDSTGDGGGGDNIPPDTGAPGGNDSGRAKTGTKEQRALLDTLAMAEGTYSSGYSTWLDFRKHGPDNLTNLTIDEVHELQGTFLKKFGAKSAAVGRYQFVPLREHARRFGANTSTQKFTPEFQDRLALFLAENRGVNTKEPIDSNDVLLLGKEWASVPGGGYGQDRYTVKQVLDMYKSLYGTVDMSPNVQAPRPEKPPSGIQQNKLAAPETGQQIKYSPEELEALQKANPELDIKKLLGSNVKNYSTQFAMALQEGRRKPKTNTLIFNNKVVETRVISEPSSGGNTIVVAGGLNSSDRRNKYLSSIS